MIINYSYFLCFINTLFIVGLVGICFSAGSFLRILICFEVLLVSVSLNFILSSVFFNNEIGLVFVFCILIVSACEVALGLMLLLYSFFLSKQVDLEDFNKLRG